MNNQGNFMDYDRNDPIHDPNHDYDSNRNDSNHTQMEERESTVQLSYEEIKDRKFNYASDLITEANKKYEKYKKLEDTEKQLKLVVDYEKAAAIFKEIFEHKYSADCHVFCVDLYLLSGEKEKAAKACYFAGIQYSKIDEDELFINYMVKAIELYNESSMFLKSAKISLSVAKRYKDSNEFDEALKFYEYTCTLYKHTKFFKNMNEVKEDIALMLIKVKPPQYSKSADVYEEIGCDIIQTNEKKSYKYFLNALAVHIMGGNIKPVADRFEQYEKLCDNFEKSIQATFIVKVAEAVHHGDFSKFDGAVQNFGTVVLLRNQFLREVIALIRTHFYAISSSSRKISALEHKTKQYDDPLNNNYSTGKGYGTTYHGTGNPYYNQNNRHHHGHHNRHYNSHNYGYKQYEKKYVSNYNTKVLEKFNKKKSHVKASRLDYEIDDEFDGTDFDIFA